MSDPVTLIGDGMTYEYSSIERWIAEGNTTSPVTNAKLAETPEDLQFVRVQFVRSSIRAWRESVGADLVREHFGANANVGTKSKEV